MSNKIKNAKISHGHLKIALNIKVAAVRQLVNYLLNKSTSGYQVSNYYLFVFLFCILFSDGGSYYFGYFGICQHRII